MWDYKDGGGLQLIEFDLMTGSLKIKLANLVKFGFFLGFISSLDSFKCLTFFDFSLDFFRLTFFACATLFFLFQETKSRVKQALGNKNMIYCISWNSVPFINVDTRLKTALIQILYASLQPSSICIKFLCASFRLDFTSAEISRY